MLSMLASVFVLEESRVNRCFCALGERIFVPDDERDRSIALCLDLVLDGIELPLLAFRTPFRRVLRTDREAADAPCEKFCFSLLSVGVVLTPFSSCVSGWASVDMIADGVDKCQRLLISSGMNRIFRYFVVAFTI